MFETFHKVYEVLRCLFDVDVLLHTRMKKMRIFHKVMNLLSS